MIRNVVCSPTKVFLCHDLASTIVPSIFQPKEKTQ